jgi:hypothetical protein
MGVIARTRAVGQLVLTALCWSLGGVLIKTVGWPPMALAAGVVLTAVTLRAARSIRTGRPVLAAATG